MTTSQTNGARTEILGAMYADLGASDLKGLMRTDIAAQTGRAKGNTTGRPARIEIRRRLHDGIYRSQGGGQETVMQSFVVGPRNVAKATDALMEIREQSERAYGNVGCGRTWAMLVDAEGEINVTAALLDLRMQADAWKALSRSEQNGVHRSMRPVPPRTATALRSLQEDLDAAEEAARDHDQRFPFGG